MKRILHCIKDAYITNRIIRNSFRATDANVGAAGTLDLFKLAGESSIGTGNGPYISGTIEPIELSRLLMKFDLDPLRELTGSILDISHPSFKCEMKMSDVLGGQTLPSDFQVALYPLSKSFDEGQGRDVIAFEDVSSCNYLTASVSGDTAVTWSQSGANNISYIGDPSADVVSGSSVLGDVFSLQSFIDGSEDLHIDVTKVVSATLKGLLPDHGFRLSFSGTHETNDRTLFVKRFASRHGPNTRLHPKIEVSFNNSVQDHRESFYFDVTGSLFLKNFNRGTPANLLTSAGEVTGQNSLLVTLTSGSSSGTFTSVITASQHTIGANAQTGVYSASFSIGSDAQLLSGAINNYASATFNESWTSLDGLTTFYDDTLVIKRIIPQVSEPSPSALKLNITNMKESYKNSERVRFRVFAQDDSFNFISTRLPFASKSVIFHNMHWQLRDALDDTIIFPFDTLNNSTKMSTDTIGMYFEVFMSDLDVGRVYAFDALIDTGGNQKIYESFSGKFRVES